MRLPLLTAALLAGAPLGLAAAQAPSIGSAGQMPAKAPLKAPPVKQVGAPTPQLVVTTLVGGSDDCSNAAVNDAISGTGTFAVNSVGATSGAPLGSCGAIGTDVWFHWTATLSGVATVSTCGVSGDSVIAIWADGAPSGTCPTTQIACLDDFCGLQTQLNFPCTAGTKYFIELGSFAGGAGYNGTFSIAISPPAANDDCLNPIVVVGAGPHPFDNSAASTGTQGQAEAICTFFGSTAINNDVWYTWTSPFTGTARVDTCGGVVDTKIAIYNGAGCPAGAAIACNDDACGVQTRADFAAVAGNTYTIQLGLYPFTTTGGTGTFSINQFFPATNDGCAAPTVVVGNGPHPFDTTTATTGTEGQAEALCLAFGSTNLYNDVWFTWTAPSTGNFEVSMCAGGVGFDTRIAVYPGSGCPVSGTALACNDDFCGLVSAACFAAVAGQAYTVQIGSYSAAGTGTGTFQFSPSAPPAGGCTPLDDGSSENSIGLTAGGALGWIVGFGSAGGGSVTVASIETAYGTPLFPGGYVPSGPVTVAVWDDPNDDGNPSDCVLLGTTTAAVSGGSVDTDVFQVVTLSTPITVSGVFFAGAVVNHLAGEFPSSLDQSSGSGSACGGGGGGGSWVFGDTTGTANLTNLTANNVPVQSLTSVGFPGNWLLRVNCGPGFTGTAYCFGDGTGTACPCGNNGAAGNGCASSVNAGGANLSATGNATVGSDTVVLAGTGMSNSSALYFQGTSQISVVFGDGLRCAGGTVIRLGTKTNVAGASQYPAAGDPPVSVRGLVPSGATRDYQVWYRNAAAFCTVSTFNLSNGLEIVWQ